jgi:hypothetical protein
MNMPNVIQAATCLSLACSPLAPSDAQAVGGPEDALFQSAPPPGYAALPGIEHALPKVRGADARSPDSALAFCMPDLYCRLTPDTEAHDDTSVRLSRTTRAPANH